MQDKNNPPLSKDEIIAQYNKNTGAGDYQPEEVADIATANTDLKLTPQDYNSKRIVANIRDKSEA